jgi:putative hydrolase of the HAD superfamily
MPSSTLTTIGFDADDTLWQNEHFFRLTEGKFAAMLLDYAEKEHIATRLLEAEKRNLKFYGYGIKGFTLSMIDTAIEITDGRVPASVIADILDISREMTQHPVHTLPHVNETLEALAGSFKLILITKGDLFEQERKVAESGLGDIFEAVEIVSEKRPSTYERIFSQYGDGPAHSMMVGNSLKSDVVPAIEAGGWGVHVPHQLTWALELCDPPTHSPRFHRIDHLGELVGVIDRVR